MRVLLAGGGSGGSSAPVLAVAQELRTRRSCEFLYVGTASGPERRLVESLGIPFRSVETGKLRRYWDLQNLLDIFRVPLGIAQATGIVASFKPDVAFAAGGFAAIPPLLAASFRRVPIAIHQQDVEPGLANRILAPFATTVTVTFPASISHFPRGKTRLAGNPVRPEILLGSRQEAQRIFGLEQHLPVVLATGGGIGAAGLNRLVAAAVPLMEGHCQVIHVTGRGKGVEIGREVLGYHQVEFLTDGMAHALAAADLVVSRAGLSTLTELATLCKPSILIPMPESHQNANARVFGEAGAAVVAQERTLDGERLAAEITSLLENAERLADMGVQAGNAMLRGAESRIADEIERIART